MARSHAYRIDGLGDLLRALKQAESELVDLRELHRDVGTLVVRAARPAVPVLSGALVGSLRVIPSATAATVRAGSSGPASGYAGVIHFGWAEHNIEPTPYLFETVDDRYAQIIHRYESEVAKISDRIQ